MTITPKHRFALAKLGMIGGEVLLLLLYAFSRFHDLGQFPLFIDEAFHIDWARDVWSLHPFEGAPDGKLLIPIAAAMFWPLANALWVSRAAVVLIGVLGLAGLTALGNALFDRRVGLVAGILWLTLPYAFFFERLVLADSLAASLAILSAALIVFALKRSDQRIAVLAGVVLALAVLSKLSMLVYLGIPAACWLLIKPRRELWRTVVWLYGASLSVLMPILLLAMRRGDIGFGNAARFSSAETASIGSRLIDNIAAFFAWIPDYMGWPLLALTGIGIAWAVIRRDRSGLFAVALIGLPVVEFWLLSTYSVIRYYLPAAAPAMLLIAALLMWLFNRFPRLAPLVIGVLGALLIVVPGVLFVRQYFHAPSQLRLPPPDRRDYITHSTSGFGLIDGVAWLADYTQTTPTTVICKEQIMCVRLSIYLDAAPNLSISNRDILTPQWVEDEFAAGRAVILAQDEPPISTPFNYGDEYVLTLVEAFVRPDNLSSFNFYEIRAAP